MRVLDIELAAGKKQSHTEVKWRRHMCGSHGLRVFMCENLSRVFMPTHGVALLLHHRGLVFQVFLHAHTHVGRGKSLAF